MLILSTSTGFCQGDDFIRDGVRALLGWTGGEVWMDRCGCGQAAQRWRMAGTMGQWCDHFKNASAFVMAGTPGWLNDDVGWIDLCLQHDTPIWLVGVSSRQHFEWRLPEIKRLIRVATARDAEAVEVLTEHGIEHARFLEPAFHAPYIGPREKRFDIVLCYRHRRSIWERGSEAYVAAYLGLWARYRDRIDRLVVHEAREIAPARDLFGVEPWYSGEPRAYADLYCATRHYIGGRLHGAVPVLAGGGEAHLLYDNPKTGALTACDWLPVRAWRHDEWEQVELGLSGDAVQERILADRAAHAAYLQARIGES